MGRLCWRQDLHRSYGAHPAGNERGTSSSRGSGLQCPGKVFGEGYNRGGCGKRSEDVRGRQHWEPTLRQSVSVFVRRKVEGGEGLPVPRPRGGGRVSKSKKILHRRR